MINPQSSNRWTGTTCLSILNLCLNGFAALLCLIWLFLIPSDTKNAWLFGFSTRRLGIAFILLSAIVITIIGLFFVWRKNKSLTSLVKIIRNYSAVLSAVNLGTFILSIYLLALPTQANAAYTAAFTRLKPLIAWISLTTMQGFLFFSMTRTLNTPVKLAGFEGELTAAVRRLLVDRRWIAPASAGAVLGLVGAFLFGFPTAALRTEIPSFLPFFFGVGFILVLVGLLYSGWVVRAAPFIFVILILTGTTINLTRYPSDIAAGRANLRFLPDASAVALGKEFHYSLSVYHIFSSFYPNLTITSPPGLLDSWGLERGRMENWIPCQLVETAIYDPNLTSGQVELLLSLEPDEVEINTVKGSVFYYFFPSKQPPASPVVYLLQSGSRRFVLPAEDLESILPGYVDR